MGRLCLSLLETEKVSSKASTPFCTLTSNEWELLLFCNFANNWYFQVLGGFWFVLVQFTAFVLILSHFYRHVEVPLLFWITDLVMTNDVEPLFTCTLSISMTIWWVSLQIFWPFIDFLVFLLSFENSLNILDTNYLTEMCLANSLLICGLLFHYFNSVFCIKNIKF